MAGGAAAMLITLLVGCGDDDSDTAVPEELCPAVQAWSDSTVDAADAFRHASPDLDPSQRRTRYAEAFDDVAARLDELEDYLADLDLPEPVAARLDEALADVSETIDDGAAEAAALPNDAYAVRAVREGSLITSVEKVKAIVFQALAELADDPATGVPAGAGDAGPSTCRRRRPTRDAKGPRPYGRGPQRVASAVGYSPASKFSAKVSPMKPSTP